MSEIHVLDNNLINKIAAGEVVERPASVVKELMENSVDAGATSICVEIAGGGIDMIKITDNGKGIPKEQVETAFKRHATSKINDFDDLENIMTLGFRGEALSSISSVSQVEIITRTKDEETALKMEIAGGKTLGSSEVGAVVGTVITIKNLFYNTPARRKFLKKAATESGYINDVINRIALGHPNILIKYINNKNVVLYTSGNDDLKTCVFNIYGKEVVSKTIDVISEKNGYKLYGLIGMPEISRANRTYENFFINGRYIKSKLVSDAIEDAYRGKLMGGRFPIFILDLLVPSNTVDINAHPTKLEARFSDEDFIYEFVYDAVYGALKNRVLIPDIKFKENKADKLIIIEDNENKEDIEADSNSDILNNVKNQELIKSVLGEKEDDKKLVFPQNREEIAKKLEQELLVVEDNTTKEGEKKSEYYDFIDHTPVNTGGVVSVAENSENNVNNIAHNNNKADDAQIEQLKIEENNQNLIRINEKEKFFDNYTIVGQIFKTYWLIEQDECVYMIDQHAAHERVLYEEFMEKLKKQAVVSQRLIQPIAIDLSEREIDILESNFELIKSFGFELEEFGKNTYAIRSVPYILKNPENVSFFRDVIDILGEKKVNNIYDTKIDAIATMACKAAVKGNDKLDYEEAKALIEKIVSLENPFNCPHGRPTIVKMTKYDVEKFFKRVL